MQFADSCITRLRVELGNPDLVDEQAILATGATGIIKIGNNLQIIIGTEVQFIVDAMNDILM
ncbi:MAG: PTS sugar transporter [Thomasclavelia ramosa]